MTREQEEVQQREIRKGKNSEIKTKLEETPKERLQRTW